LPRKRTEQEIVWEFSGFEKNDSLNPILHPTTSLSFEYPISNKNIAKKINGKYWMYFGDTNIFLASSENLIDWEISENEENKTKISVLDPRMGYFDSRLVESGPFALYKEKRHFLLIYNANNAANFNDVNLLMLLDRHYLIRRLLLS
jgi:predicted GH43/DUF377 family glycosyl hydrolase